MYKIIRDDGAYMGFVGNSKSAPVDFVTTGRELQVSKEVGDRLMRNCKPELRGRMSLVEVK